MASIAPRRWRRIDVNTRRRHHVRGAMVFRPWC